MSGLVTIGSHREQLGSYRKWELLKRDREGEREMKMERKRSSIKSCAFWWKPSDPSQISRPHFQPPSETSVISRPLLLMVHTNNLKSQWPPTANICFPHSQVDWAALLQALDWPDSGQFPLASYFGTSCQAAQPNKQAHSGFCSAQVYKHSIGQSVTHDWAYHRVELFIFHLLWEKASSHDKC